MCFDGGGEGGGENDGKLVKRRRGIDENMRKIWMKIFKIIDQLINQVKIGSN